MRAIQVHHFGGPEVLQLEQKAKPTPKANDVLVRVHAAGVLPADWKRHRGLFEGIHTTTFPYVPGSAFSGVIEAVGDAVSDFSAGQAVFGRTNNGAYAEYTAAGLELLAVKPEGLNFTDAATLSGGATTAWMTLFDALNLQAGQRILIHGGAGGVGSFAVQFAHWKGAEVISTTSTANVEYVRSLGADTVIDYTITPFDEVVRNVDVVFDTIGGDTQARSWNVLKQGGALASIVQPPSQEKAQEIGGQGLWPRRVARGAELSAIADLIVAGTVKATIQTILPLAEAPQAHELSETGHGRGRIVLHVAD